VYCFFFKKKSNAKISVFTKKSKNYRKYLSSYADYYKKYKSYIKNDYTNSLVEYNRSLSKKESTQSGFCIGKPRKNDINKIDEIINDSQNGMDEIINNLFNYKSDITLVLMINIHVFFRLYKMKIYTEKPLNSIDDIINYDKQNGTSWYRGQTNKNWQLVPSFFRNSKKSLLWDWSEIYKDYQSKPSKVSLIKKLNEIGINTSEFPYKTAAFIQHSIGYSPLIDFTRSPEVAISFALSNGSSMGSYYGDDACVFVLELSNCQILTDNNINVALKSSKTQVFMKNELIIRLLENLMWVNLMLANEKSKIDFINQPTNDRMMFQKGTFILYDNVIIIGDEVYMSYEKIDFTKRHFIKYNIDVKSKEKLYEDLMNKYPQYHQRYLLDPYLYLGEPDK
jgi:hypothetical protein